MSAINVLLQNLGVKFLGLGIEAGEAFLRVGDEDTTVTGSLHGTEHTRTRRRPFKTYIEITFEGPGGIFIVESLCHGNSAVWLGNTLIFVGKAEFGQGSTSDKKSGGVG
jgi:hypothetical protein